MTKSWGVTCWTSIPPRVRGLALNTPSRLWATETEISSDSVGKFAPQYSFNLSFYPINYLASIGPQGVLRLNNFMPNSKMLNRVYILLILYLFDCLQFVKYRLHPSLKGSTLKYWTLSSFTLPKFSCSQYFSKYCYR